MERYFVVSVTFRADLFVGLRAIGRLRLYGMLADAIIRVKMRDELEYNEGAFRNPSVRHFTYAI
jgi:hypothetical protein